MVAVVAVDPIDQRSNTAQLDLEALGDVRVEVPRRQHPLVEPVDRKQVVTLDQLKVSRSVIKDRLRSIDDLVEARGTPEHLNFGHYAPRVGPVERFPETLRDLEPSGMVETGGEIAGHLVEARRTARQQDDVGVGR